MYPDPKQDSTLDAGKDIGRIVRAKRLEVIGPDDVVVEISGNSLEEIYRTTGKIASLFCGDWDRDAGRYE